MNIPSFSAEISDMKTTGLRVSRLKKDEQDMLTNFEPRKAVDFLKV